MIFLTIFLETLVLNLCKIQAPRNQDLSLLRTYNILLSLSWLKFMTWAMESNSHPLRQETGYEVPNRGSLCLLPSSMTTQTLGMTQWGWNDLGTWRFQLLLIAKGIWSCSPKDLTREPVEFGPAVSSQGEHGLSHQTDVGLNFSSFIY